MAERTKHASYQQRYRNKLADINKTNAEFMAYAEQKDPDFVAGFFAEKSVIFAFLTAFLVAYIKLIFPPFFPNLIQKQQQQRHEEQLQQQANKEEYNRCVFLYENQVRKRKHSLFSQYITQYNYFHKLFYTFSAKLPSRIHYETRQ